MKKLLFENIGLKISAVLISVLLWLFVTSRGQSEISFEAPIEFKDVPVGLGIVSSSTKEANVTVKGQERIMKSLRPADIRLFLDLSKARKGEGSFHINKNDVKLPYAMSVTNVDPSTIRVKLDETVTKAVAVRPLIMGVPDPGFSVKSIAVEPKSVVIQGLKNEVRKISEIGTEPIDVSGMRETQTQEVPIDPGGANIRPDRNTVKVTVVIGGAKR